jgi:predicted alpha/beta superfamily hydrolase
MVTPILPLSPARLIIFLLFIQLIPPMIVVGIGNVLGVRTHDLTPTHSIIDPYGKIDTSAGLSLQTSGGGENFLQFIKDELMPYIEKKYKPAPYKIFSGHSFGGLMTFYCLTKHPEMFNAYISASPALWWDNKIHLKVATKNLRNTDYRKKLFFFSDASEGEIFHQDALYLDSLLGKESIPGLKYRYVYYPDESHVSETAKA